MAPRDTRSGSSTSRSVARSASLALLAGATVPLIATYTAAGVEPDQPRTRLALPAGVEAPSFAPPPRPVVGVPAAVQFAPARPLQGVPALVPLAPPRPLQGLPAVVSFAPDRPLQAVAVAISGAPESPIRGVDAQVPLQPGASPPQGVPSVPPSPRPIPVGPSPAPFPSDGGAPPDRPNPGTRPTPLPATVPPAPLGPGQRPPVLPGPRPPVVIDPTVPGPSTNPPPESFRPPPRPTPRDIRDLVARLADRPIIFITTNGWGFPYGYISRDYSRYSTDIVFSSGTSFTASGEFVGGSLRLAFLLSSPFIVDRFGFARSVGSPYAYGSPFVYADYSRSGFATTHCFSGGCSVGYLVNPITYESLDPFVVNGNTPPAGAPNVAPTPAPDTSPRGVAMALLRSGKFADAADAFRPLLLQHGDDGAARARDERLMAVALFAAGQRPAAAEAALDAYSRFPALAEEPLLPDIMPGSSGSGAFGGLVPTASSFANAAAGRKDAYATGALLLAASLLQADGQANASGVGGVRAARVQGAQRMIARARELGLDGVVADAFEQALKNPNTKR